MNPDVFDYVCVCRIRANFDNPYLVNVFALGPISERAEYRKGSSHGNSRHADAIEKSKIYPLKESKKNQTFSI